MCGTATKTQQSSRMSLRRIIRSAQASFLLSILLIVSSVIVVVKSAISQTPGRPNIVILLADNLGAQDVQALSSASHTTRNIASLAVEGINLTNWNSVAHLCSASRASLLTGRYPVRSGIYPGVFSLDSANGMLPNETTTLAAYLKDRGYATSIVGKWHLGHREGYLPIHQGFDEWLGIPYAMSGGSIDNHVCGFDDTETMWLPLFQNNKIIQQPVNVQNLGEKYASQATDFIRRNSQQNSKRPFFLFMSFSHVHQLCAPRDKPEQEACQWAGKHTSNGLTADFQDAVAEMDWITGEILAALDESGVKESTVVLFTSDNGPWVAEQSCSGQKGRYEARWLQENVSHNCTACPHGYVSSPTPEYPRRCVLLGTSLSMQGVHCGKDSGLGSAWEANLRVPAFARWPGRISPGIETNALVSTLDIVPTILSLTSSSITSDDKLDKLTSFDGIDISSVLFGQQEAEQYSQVDYNNTIDNSIHDRVLFFWRDGFSDGPLPQPFGRFDVVAVKVGRIKAWFWTKSAHYNDDPAVFHNPPLLFDTVSDPGEAHPLDPQDHLELIDRVLRVTTEHKNSINWTNPGPLALARDPKYIPCSNRENGCRTEPFASQIS